MEKQCRPHHGKTEPATSGEVLLLPELAEVLAEVEAVLPVLVEVLHVVDDLEVEAPALPVVEAAWVHLVFDGWPHVPLNCRVDASRDQTRRALHSDRAREPVVLQKPVWTDLGTALCRVLLAEELAELCLVLSEELSLHACQREQHGGGEGLARGAAPIYQPGVQLPLRVVPEERVVALQVAVLQGVLEAVQARVPLHVLLVGRGLLHQLHQVVPEGLVRYVLREDLRGYAPDES
eukprot:UN0321